MEAGQHIRSGDTVLSQEIQIQLRSHSHHSKL